MLFRLSFFLILAVLVFSTVTLAQECKPPEIVANKNTDNLFSPEQEMIFGDLFFQSMSSEIRLVRDPLLNEHLENIGRKLVKHLPDIGLKYKFYLIDIPEANAFNIPGGHVFVSRKLVSFSKDEGELAGVIAHELGHAVVRHSAQDMSRLLKKVLNVTQLGDRKDVTDKFNLLIERARTKRVKSNSGHRNEQQMEADKIGLYAMVAAGYEPESFTSFFDRLTETEGKTGGWFSDLFGGTTPNQKRLRVMIKATESLPAECRDNLSTNASDDFVKWQADVVSYRVANRKERLPGLTKKIELKPKLRTDVRKIEVTPNGKYLLAQDDYSITIAQRSPMKVLFQIPALEANRVSFTPDQENLVFITDDLRYEKWNIATQKAVEIKELVLRSDCHEYGLSPNGEFLTCVDESMRVQIINTKTGKRIWEKKKAFELSYFELLLWLTTGIIEGSDGGSFFNIEYSPDSKYVLISRSHRHRFRFKINNITQAKSDTKLIAIDLTTMEKVKYSKSLKKFTSRPFVFVGTNRIMAMHEKKNNESGIFSFPEGKRISKFPLAGDELKLTSNPKYVIVKPLPDVRLGIIDIEKGIIASGINKEDAAMWENSFIYESSSGKLIQSEVSYNNNAKRFDTGKSEILDLPASSLGYLYAAEVSPSFKWLAFSARSRGGMWNLETGERKIFARGFRGALVGDDGGSVAAFPSNGSIPKALAIMNGNNKQVSVLSPLPKRGAKQYGRFVLKRKSLDKEDNDLTENVRFEIENIVSKKVVWKKNFPKSAPRYFFDDFSGRIIFYWRVGGKSGSEKLKEYPAIQKRAKSLKNDEDNFFVEVIDAFANGNVAGKLLVETGNRSFSIADGLSERDWLVLYDTEGRVLVYKLKTGVLHQRFFGHHAVVNPVGSEIVVENFPGEVAVYDMNSGQKKANVVFNDGVAFTRFSFDGKSLFVLTDSQTAYIFNVAKLMEEAKTPLP